MGKPFNSELSKLSSTYRWALEASVDNLSSFVYSIKTLPLLTVGSGGSLTSAIFASVIHQRLSELSRYLTPFDILSLDNPLSSTAVMFYSAGGRNYDVLTSFRAAVHLEPEQLAAVCMTTGSKLRNIADTYSYVTLTEYDLPSGKDGFLATNSLLASAVLTIRAYKEIIPTKFELPASLEEMIHPEASKELFLAELKRQIRRLLNKKTIIVLYGEWGKPAAHDIESKMTEAALANIQLADYRNFAHGRHHWLAKHHRETGVIALVTPDVAAIAKKTLDLIPENIPTAVISSDRADPIGALALILKLMYIVLFFGKHHGIDPGKPGVPKFGSRLYNLKYSTSEKSKAILSNRTSLEQRAISRKAGTYVHNLDFDIMCYWREALRLFLERITNTEFNGIVFDYDGTLCDPAHRFTGPPEVIGKHLVRLLNCGIAIGIATGRGASVRKDLQRILPEKSWPEVLVGYYNASDISLLSDNSHPDKESDLDPNLSSILHLLKGNELISKTSTVTIRPKQITVEPAKPFSQSDIFLLCQDVIIKSGLTNVKLYESSHSIDILAQDVSKRSLVRSLADRISLKGHNASILCIGDKGRWPGNDVELLGTEFSLSVNIVSPARDSCWNLSPLGHRGEQAVLDYLNSMVLRNNSLTLDINKMESMIR